MTNRVGHRSLELFFYIWSCMVSESGLQDVPRTKEPTMVDCLVPPVKNRKSLIKVK